MALTRVGGGILQQPIDVGIITATSIQVGSGTTIHDAGIDLGSGNITSNNINSTGIVTSTGLDVNGNGDISGDLSVSGNVSIGGTLTYEDVTNIDSVGIITARDGIHVTGGSVGIGTDTIDGNSQLHIKNTSGNAKITLETNETYDSYINFSGATSEASIGYEPTNNAVVISNAADGLTSAERLRITSGGKIGINNINPTYDLDLLKTASGVGATMRVGATAISGINTASVIINNGGTGNASLDFKYESAATPRASIYVYRSDQELRFDTAGTERLRITSAGKIGINTASPRAVLDIEGNAENATLMLHSNDANANLQFSDNTGGARILNYGGDLAFRTGTNAHVFGTGDSEALRISSSGKIGINTASPFAELDITSTTETTTGTLSQHGIRLSAPGAADGEVIPITGGFLSNQDRARAGIGFISRVAGSSVGYAGAIGFYTRSSADGNGLWRSDEKVRINESGTLIVDAGGDAQDIQIISHSGGSGHGKIYLRGNASNESSSIQLNHYGHADYHISAGRAANGLFSITRTDGDTDGIIMNANGNVGIKNTGTSSKLHIGDLVGSVSNDINTTHTSLIIKQTNNDNKSGLYIERSGERKGYYMWMNPGGGAGDGLTFTRNNNGTKSDALILDRDANLTVGGHIYPSSNNTYDLGSTANAWRNVYTNDLHLSNMSGGGNDVDGTTGDWTIQEGEENLYIINNRSGKKYKFNLQEVN